MQHHYSAHEAIHKLGIPRSTFYYLVRIGLIKKINLPLRKQAIYLKDQIDALALERDRVLMGMEVQATTGLAFGTPTASDLRQVAEIVNMSSHERFRYVPNRDLDVLRFNPQAIHVLKDVAEDHVLGMLKMSPLKPQALAKLLDSTQTTSCEPEPEDYRPFAALEQELLDVYLFDVVTREKASPYVGARLFREAFHFLVSLLDEGVIVKSLYTTARSDRGRRLVTKLGFAPLDPPAGNRSDAKDHSAIQYRLDLLDTKPKSVLVATYQRRYRNLRRRVRRYTAYVQAHAQPSPTPTMHTSVAPAGFHSTTRGEGWSGRGRTNAPHDLMPSGT